MLRSLSYSVTFPATGHSLAGEFDFAKGMTAISGSNEAGKTMILEMIRYSLWGNWGRKKHRLARKARPRAGEAANQTRQRGRGANSGPTRPAGRISHGPTTAR